MSFEFLREVVFKIPEAPIGPLGIKPCELVIPKVKIHMKAALDVSTTLMRENKKRMAMRSLQVSQLLSIFDPFDSVFEPERSM
jgi:hypothetical protein